MLFAALAVVHPLITISAVEQHQTAALLQASTCLNCSPAQECLIPKQQKQQHLFKSIQTAIQNLITFSCTVCVFHPYNVGLYLAKL